MPRLACDGNGNSQGCWSGADITEAKVTDLADREINTADAGDTIKLWIKVYSPHYPCDNFHIDYDFDGTIVGCYEDTVSYNTTWHLQWQYTIPLDTPAGWKDIWLRETIAGDKSYTSLYVYASGCEQYTTQSTCEAAGCYWYNGACHQSRPSCYALTSQIECERFGCWWYDGSCHPPYCSFVENQTACEGQDCYWWSDNTCHSIPEDIICTNITNEMSCWEAGCHWWNGSCHDEPPPTCEQINNYADCLSNNCYWYDGSCHTDPPPPPCSSYINQYSCEAADCYWWPDNKCHSDPYDPTCSDHTNQSDCENAGCKWWNGACHISDPTKCSDLNNSIDCLGYNCYWYDSACHSDPNGNGDCAGLSEADCKATTGCYWYQKYFWEEPSCHSEEQNMLMDYLPFIIAGVGGVALIVIVLSKRKPAPQYYPPPMPYPSPMQYPQYPPKYPPVR